MERKGKREKRVRSERRLRRRGVREYEGEIQKNAIERRDERVARRHWSAVAHDLPREEKRPGRRGRRRNEGRNKRDGKSRKNTDRGEIVARRYY